MSHGSFLEVKRDAKLTVCPVWQKSTHAKQIEAALNETCKIITRCLRPTIVGKHQCLPFSQH